MPKVDKILYNTLIGILFCILFVPLFTFNFLPFPQIVTKEILFRFLTTLAAGIWLPFAINYKNLKPKINRLFWSLVALFLITVLTSVFGSDITKSFLGNFERMSGVISLFHIFLYFIILTSTLDLNIWEKYLKTAVLVGLLVALGGLWEQFIFYRNFGEFTRIDSTLGNPTTLAAYLMLIFFINIILFYKKEKGLKKFLQKPTNYIYVATFVLIPVAIYNTASRGVFLGLFAGLITSIVLQILQTKKVKIKTVLFVIVLLTAPISIFLYRNSDFIQSSNTLSRFANTSITTESSDRLILWKISFESFKQKPVLGWGLENFDKAFNKNYDVRLRDSEPWFDRAHNFILDWLIAAGVLGLAAYIYFIFNIYKRIFTNKENKVLEKSLLAGALTAFLVQNLFTFDILSTLMIFYILVAYANKETKSYQEINDFNKKHFIISIALFIFIFTSINLGALRSGTYLIHAFNETDLEKKFDFLDLSYKSSLFGKEEVAFQAGRIASLLDENQKKQYRNIFIKTELKLKNSLKKDEDDLKTVFMLANFYKSYGLWEKSIEQHLNALKISPERVDVMFSLASVYHENKQYDKAVPLRKKILEIAPGYQDAFTYYASELIFNNQVAEAENLISEKYPNKLYPNDLIINAYASLKNYQKVSMLWKERIKQDPTNIQARISLAASYNKLGEKNSAIKVLFEIIKIRPDLEKEIMEYISQILYE